MKTTHKTSSRYFHICIEEKYTDRALSYHDLGLNDYTPEVVAYHCSLLHDAQLVSSYVSRYADDRLYAFYVGRLTWEGHEFLDKIKNDTVWNKTLKIIKEKGLPLALDTVKDIAAAVAATMLQAAISDIKAGG